MLTEWSRILKFSASDLSDIARTLDVLEESYDFSNTGNSSTNMDDTGNSCLVFCYFETWRFIGFFSVQVLDKALEVWGLKYIFPLSETEEFSNILI